MTSQYDPQFEGRGEAERLSLQREREKESANRLANSPAPSRPLKQGAVHDFYRQLQGKDHCSYTLSTGERIKNSPSYFALFLCLIAVMNLLFAIFAFPGEVSFLKATYSLAIQGIVFVYFFEHTKRCNAWNGFLYSSLINIIGSLVGMAIP